MCGKLSSFKCASRSLAKTGFENGALVQVKPSKSENKGSRSGIVSGTHSGVVLGCLLGGFWEPLGDPWAVLELIWVPLGAPWALNLGEIGLPGTVRVPRWVPGPKSTTFESFLEAFW